MADVGQTPIQAKQSMQMDSSHSALPSASINKAATGQTPIQAAHPIHKSFATITGIQKPPYLTIIALDIISSS
jgi:hypothetical protein